MSTYQRLIYVIVLGMLLVCACTAPTPASNLPGKSVTPSAAIAPKPASTATPEPTVEIDPALRAAMEKCGNTLPGLACLVEGPVQVTAQSGRTLTPFKQPGQVINLANLQTLKLGGAGSTKGMVVMRIQTEWPEGAFTAVAFGDVELANQVPYGTREFNPMQSLTLKTGENKAGQDSLNGLLVASPEDGNLSTLVVNDLELSFGSGGWLTSQEGGVSLLTLWDEIGAWFQDRITGIKSGFGIKLSPEEIKDTPKIGPIADPGYEKYMKELARYFTTNYDKPYDPAYKTISKAFEIIYGPLAKKLDENCKGWRSQDLKTISDCIKKQEDAEKKFRALEERRRKQKAWKGGWWKMTYGPVTRTGQCKSQVVADGYDGGDEKPYTTEIPICRGNNGNTILMYESGASYDRIRPNLYAKSYISEFDLLGNGNSTIEGHFTVLQVVSPTRMILTKAGTEADSCTSASTVYLDFVRDDPNIRCGHIIYINPYQAPKPPTPTPEPKPVEPPLKGTYQVRVGTLAKACDPAAKPFAPSFTVAALSLTPENKLVIDAASKKYELELSNLAYSDDSGPESIERLGIFTLQQPADSSFNLTMSLFQMSDQQWSGNWLVANGDASKLCTGSIDFLPPD